MGGVASKASLIDILQGSLSDPAAVQPSDLGTKINSAISSITVRPRCRKCTKDINAGKVKSLEKNRFHIACLCTVLHSHASLHPCSPAVINASSSPTFSLQTSDAASLESITIPVLRSLRDQHPLSLCVLINAVSQLCILCPAVPWHAVNHLSAARQLIHNG